MTLQLCFTIAYSYSLNICLLYYVIIAYLGEYNVDVLYNCC